MQWTKKGLIFSPSQGPEWMHSHCQLPVADQVEGDIYRIYFASRSPQQISQIGYIEIDIHSPDKILNISEQPILQPGPIGHFDQFGVYPSSVINYQGKKYLYYIGWIRGYTSPLFYAAIGLAISEDNGLTFQKYSNVPIMERSIYDPCLVTAPYVFIENEKFHMFYVSGIKWLEEPEIGLRSFYHLKYAKSDDGIHWKRSGKVIVDLSSDIERDISRASIIKENDHYKMWFAFNTTQTPYRLGYAESIDGLNWDRQDHKASISTSKQGFDSHMVCYPFVIKHHQQKFMFYNGNSFGKEGIGLAIQD